MLISPAAVALSATLTTAVVGLLVLWIRWSIRTAVKEVVNGKVDQVQRTVNHISEWTVKHDTSHDVQQGALLAALARQGFDVPDGWR
jgi:hypothetical protein